MWGDDGEVEGDPGSYGRYGARASTLREIWGDDGEVEGGPGSYGEVWHARVYLEAHAQLLEEALVRAPELRHRVRRRLPAGHMGELLDGVAEALEHRLPREETARLPRMPW